MSIIYDALKKTEKSVNNPESNTAGNDRDPEVEAALKKKRMMNKITLLLLYIVVIGGGLYIGNIFFDFLGKAKNLPKTPAKPLPLAKRQITGKRTTPTKARETSILDSIPLLSSERKKESKQPFVLNGVFFSQDEGYALVNNRVVKVGDEIEGAIVRKIDTDEVELETAGSIIKLSTK